MFKADSQIFGFILGLIGPVIGSVIYYLLQFNGMAYYEFIQFTLTSGSTSAVISLSALFNLLIFFVLLQMNMARSARGVILATFVYVLVVILLKFT